MYSPHDVPNLSEFILLNITDDILKNARNQFLVATDSHSMEKYYEWGPSSKYLLEFLKKSKWQNFLFLGELSL